MAEIGLFPLGIVLLPSERVPLHIFEPRYRELIGECIDEDRAFGLLYADEDGIRDVAVQRVGIREHLLVQGAILQRADDVGERVARPVTDDG
ncbi:MAG: LON peptidase substrate-binding domain-containing protein, partial [Actinomycetota bacterium]